MEKKNKEFIKHIPGLNKKFIAMARDWTIRNNNAGNVLKTELIEVSASLAVTPNANQTFLNVDLVAETTITGNAEESMIGDMVFVTVQNNTGGALDLIAAGDFALGTLNILAGGVASAILIYNGQNFASIVAP